MSRTLESQFNSATVGEYDAVVVGAGFAGMYMLYRLREMGMKARVFERGAGVGGTWYWNRYPGARCDVESMQYAYTFSEALVNEWDWSERYPTQSEILRYANFVADRLSLWRDIQLNTDIKSCVFDEARQMWTVTTGDGNRMMARFVMLATGVLSNARPPDIKGFETFTGPVYHTGTWPHEPVDFTGLRVGVIGTGSSGIQVIPQVAKQAKQLTVFQRTPNFSVPARNRLLTDEDRSQWRANIKKMRRFLHYESKGGVDPSTSDRRTFEDDPETQRATYEAVWGRGGSQFQRVYNDIFVDRTANEVAANFVRAKIAAVVQDKVVANLLQPRGYPFGTKRLPVDIDYFETFNRPNVTLVDIRTEPIQEVDSRGMRTESGFFELDVVILATGFDAGTGSFKKIDTRGRDGVTLSDKWREGPKNYLGLMVADFPNLFTLTGPGSPGGLANGMIAIEQHVEWIADCLAYMRKHGLHLIEAEPSAEEKWIAHCNDLVSGTLMMEANSWWNGSNIPGKPRVFMAYLGGVAAYRKMCDEVAANGYQGFTLTRRERQERAPTESETSA